MRSIDDYLLSRNAPSNFSDQSSDNALISMGISFEKLCTSLEEVGIRDPKKLTVLEFNSKLDYFEDKAKRMNKK